MSKIISSPKAYQTLATALFAASALTAYAFPQAGSGLAAKSVQVSQPKNPVNASQCLACHTTIQKLHARGRHSQVNCASCHTVKSEHLTQPKAENRPQTRFDHDSCAQCHPAEKHDLFSTKYHMQWAQKNDRPTYSYIMDANGNQKDTQVRIPRYHAGVLADVAVNRMGGRFAYKNRSDESKPVEKLWDKVYDTKPEMGNELKLMKPSLAWRPQKSVGLANLSVCMRCKSSDNMLDWAYLGEPGKAPVNRSSPALPSFKGLNYATNCNYCHDPHSAEPRVTVDYALDALINPEYKDNEFQKRTGKELAKIEVINMGMRGYNRKIGILDRYDSNLMCGQCHLSYHAVTTLKNSKGESLPGNKYPNFGTTIYSDGPLAAAEWYEKRGLWTNIHPDTGTKYAAVPTHGHMETVSLSKHGLAGVGCTDCHFAKKADGTSEHQPSLPTYKLENTCLRSGCHGAGTKFNWKTPEEAKYQITLIQQRIRNRTNHWQQTHTRVQNYLKDVKLGHIKIGDKEATDLHRAFARSMTAQSWWSTDYSDGIHNPEMHERDAIQINQELTSALNAAIKSEKK